MALVTPVKQLDSSEYRSVNCGPACAAMALAWWSWDRFIPKPDVVREAGSMGTGPTGFDDLKRGIESFTDKASALGLSAPVFTRLGYVQPDEFLRSLARRKRFHIIAIKYGIVLPYAEYRSENDYEGGHFVAATRLYVGRDYVDGKPTRFSRVRAWNLERALTMPDKLWTYVFDPLADGRRPSVQQAPQLWPASLLIKSGDGFAEQAPYDGKLPVGFILRGTRA